MSELKQYRFCGGEAHHGGTTVGINGMTVETNGKDDGITLLPCPFCGAEVEVLSDMHRTWGLVKHRDGCLFPNFRNHQISEYDFEAWNTRHVETCRIECNERSNNLRLYTLSCGHTVWTMGYTPDYCVTCGRKVEG